MKLAIFSDAPTINTGLGLVTKTIGKYFEQKGTDVNYLGACQPTQSISRIPMQSTERVQLVDYIDTRAIKEFLLRDEPDIILLISSVKAVAQWGSEIRDTGWQKPIVAYFVCDGLPVGSRTVEKLKTIDSWIVPAQVVAEHLEAMGLNKVHFAPFGIDHARFAPLPNRDELRKGANLSNRFVIGLFGRNTERKQHPRLLQAIQSLVKQGYGPEIFVYIHSQPIDNQSLEGWDLIELLKDWELENYVSFPSAEFDQLLGIPYEVNDKREYLPFQSTNHPLLNPIFYSYSYIERLNCCDLLINCSFSGGFELTALEAQACGIPLAITNDGGIFFEIYGESAILLKPAFTGVWYSGAMQHFVSPSTIAETILELMNNPSRSQELANLGLSNAMKYRWEPTCRKLWEILHEVCKFI